MKWLIYLSVLIAALLFPAERADVAKLQPVEVVCMYSENGRIVLQTDTGDRGSGNTVPQALEHLKKTTPGIVYLDTANYLLVSEDVMDWIPQMKEYLKEDTRVCQIQEVPELEITGMYLDVHRPTVTLETWSEGDRLEILQWENGKMEIKKQEK